MDGEPTQGPDYGHPYDWDWHGPWPIELAELCACGGWRFFGEGEHDVSPEHVAGRLARFDAEDIENAMAALENGLGWAASEGMSSYRWHNDDELLAIVRLALARDSA